MKRGRPFTGPSLLLRCWDNVSKSGGDTWGYFLPDALHEALQRSTQPALPDQGTLYGNMRDRFRAAGRMKCEAITKGGAVTGYRPTLKARAHNVDGTRRFIVLHFPLGGKYAAGGNIGNNGNNGEERRSGTASLLFPLTHYFSNSSGNNGNNGPLVSPVPVFAGAAELQDTHGLADLEMWAVTV